MSQHPKRIERMAQRRDQGLKHHEIGKEFDMSRQHAGRLLRQHDKQNENKDCE